MRHWKIVTVGACVVITVSAVLYAVTIKDKLDQQAGTEKKIGKDIEADAAIIAKEIDKNGLQHVIISATANQYKPSEIKAAVEEGILDTTASAIGVLKKQIQELTKISTTSQARELKAYAMLDSQKRQTFYYRDRFLQLAYRPPSNLQDTSDKGQFDFSYDADITVTQYQKRNWFLGAKKSYIDIHSNDPRTTIKGVKRLTVKQEDPAFGLRLQGVATYNFTTGQSRVGAGLQFDFKRFSLIGNYLYAPLVDQWQPEVSGRFDLIKF